MATRLQPWPFLQGGGLSQLLHGGWVGSGRTPRCWKRLGLGEGRGYVWASKEEQLFGAGRVEGVCSEEEDCARAQRQQRIRCIRLMWLEQRVSCRRGPSSRFAQSRRGTHQALHDAGRQLPLWDKLPFLTARGCVASWLEDVFATSVHWAGWGSRFSIIPKLYHFCAAVKKSFAAGHSRKMLGLLRGICMHLASPSM